jgi:hypothetical protein
VKASSAAFRSAASSRRAAPGSPSVGASLRNAMAVSARPRKMRASSAARPASRRRRLASCERASSAMTTAISAASRTRLNGSRHA